MLFTEVYRRFQASLPADAQDAQRDTDPDTKMHLRLIFHREADSIAKLPWEFLFVPDPESEEGSGSFFAGERRELILTRYVPPSFPFAEPKSERLRIVVASYTPNGEPGIGAQDWAALILQFKNITPNVTMLGSLESGA